jgi:hypothetical protein
MFNELEDSQISLERALWMSVPYRSRISAHRLDNPVTERIPELRWPALRRPTEIDWASGIAFLVLAGSAFASLIESFASLPAAW